MDRSQPEAVDGQSLLRSGKVPDAEDNLARGASAIGNLGRAGESEVAAAGG